MGIELELQLIDPKTLDLSPCSPAILKRLAPDLQNIKHELFQSMIEINTQTRENVGDLEQDLRASAAQLTEYTAAEGIAVTAAGTHPTALYRDRKLFPDERYERLYERHRWFLRRMMVFGIHFHVGVPTKEECVSLHNQLLYFLHHLLALSASSPFWQSEDTGLTSARISVYESLPTAGHAYTLKHWAHFESMLKALYRAGSIESEKDIWWDLRPRPHYGTLEIRICDAIPSLTKVAAIAAYVHCICLHLEELRKRGKKKPLPPDWFVRENKWRAARFGLEAEVISDIKGKTIGIRDEIAQTLHKLKSVMKSLGYENYFKCLNSMLTGETYYEKQRRILRETGNLRAIVAENLAEFESELHQHPAVRAVSEN